MFPFGRCAHTRSTQTRQLLPIAFSWLVSIRSIYCLRCRGSAPKPISHDEWMGPFEHRSACVLFRHSIYAAIVGVIKLRNNMSNERELCAKFIAVILCAMARVLAVMVNYSLNLECLLTSCHFSNGVFGPAAAVYFHLPVLMGPKVKQISNFLFVQLYGGHLSRLHDSTILNEHVYQLSPSSSSFGLSLSLCPLFSHSLSLSLSLPLSRPLFHSRIDESQKSQRLRPLQNNGHQFRLHGFFYQPVSRVWLV